MKKGRKEEEEEEEERELTEEEDKKSFGIHRCLPVDDGEPDWEVGGDDLTVEEYLRRVRHEARSLPQIVVCDRLHQSSVDIELSSESGNIGNEGTIRVGLGVDADSPALELPSAAWIRQFLRSFANLRRRLRREEELVFMASRPSMLTGFPERAALEEATLAAERHALISNPPSSLMPQLQELRGLDQVTIAHRIQQEVLALEGEHQRVLLNKTAAANIYALSAKIELPLHSDMAATYRSLVHMCYRWKENVFHQKDETMGKDAVCASVDVLLVIAGAFFQQDEVLARYMGELEDKEEGAL